MEIWFWEFRISNLKLRIWKRLAAKLKNPHSEISKNSQPAVWQNLPKTPNGKFNPVVDFKNNSPV